MNGACRALQIATLLPSPGKEVRHWLSTNGIVGGGAPLPLLPFRPAPRCSKTHGVGGGFACAQAGSPREHHSARRDRLDGFAVEARPATRSTAPPRCSADGRNDDGLLNEADREASAARRSTASTPARRRDQFAEFEARRDDRREARDERRGPGLDGPGFGGHGMHGSGLARSADADQDGTVRRPSSPRPRSRDRSGCQQRRHVSFEERQARQHMRPTCTAAARAGRRLSVNGEGR
jgi:hypothetical protein